MKFITDVKLLLKITQEYVNAQFTIAFSAIFSLLFLLYSYIFDAQNWRGKKWGYIADISKLQTVSTEVSAVLVNLHTEIFENGCSCIGFVEPINAFISRQAAVHNRLSDAELQEGHFHDFDEAFNWAKNIIAS